MAGFQSPVVKVTGKVCGVPVTRPLGHSRAPTPTSDSSEHGNHPSHLPLRRQPVRGAGGGLLTVQNPALQVELPRQDRKTAAVWTPAQLIEFLTAVRTDRLYALYHLVALTGLRRGEVLGLRWSDVDLERQLLFINQQVVQVGRTTHIGPPKTSRGRRVVPLDAGTVALLELHRRDQQRERQVWGAAWRDSGMVFTREDATPLSPDYLTRRFKSLVKTAGVPPIRFHGLRHTSASLALAAGVAMKVVSERLGHSAIAITADLYTHVAPTVAQDAADAIARLVHPAGGAPDVPPVIP